MAELPFFKADIGEVFPIALKKIKSQRKRRRNLENPQLRRKLRRRMKMGKRELCRSRQQEMPLEQAQVDGGAERTHHLSSAAQLGQGGDPLLASQQPQGGEDGASVQLQSQAAQGDAAPNMGPRLPGVEWEAPEVTVQVWPREQSREWESPQVTVQVGPWKPNPSWVSPSIRVEVQLQREGRWPRVTLQLRPQEGGHSGAGITLTVHLSCEPEVTPFQGRGEEELRNGEQLTPNQNREPEARSEVEKDPPVVGMVPQGSRGQRREMTKPQQGQKKEERAEVVELQEKQVRDKADLDGMVTEKQLQSQEQQQPKAEMPLQKEGQRATEMRKQDHAPRGSRGMVENLGQQVPKKHSQETPNYFVAIPIRDDQILDRIEDVQELIFNKEPDLLRALLPVQTMHLTIIVAHLGTEEEVKKAVLALQESKSKVEAILQGKDFIMTFHGIGQFNNQVVYVKMLEEDQQMLSRITEAVEECFIAMNLDILGSKDFKPHLTFLKLSKAPRLRRRGFRKICSALYQKFEDSYFGKEPFSRIDLCAMRKKKQKSGYYHCECSIHLESGGSRGAQEAEMQPGGGEATQGDPPHRAGTAAAAASCELGSSSPGADAQLPENPAELAAERQEREIHEVKALPEAPEGDSAAAGGICSKPELLPAGSDALENQEEQEKAKVGSLQRAEAMEGAPGQHPQPLVSCPRPGAEVSEGAGEFGAATEQLF